MTDFSFLGEQPFNSIHTKQTYICEIVKMSFPFSEKQVFHVSHLDAKTYLLKSTPWSLKAFITSHKCCV